MYVCTPVCILSKSRWLYWSSRTIERVSMDGSNRTEVVNITSRHYIFSLTLDYQAQVLYWVDYYNYDDSVRVNSSNVDGTNRQTFLRVFSSSYYHHFHFSFYQHGLSLFGDTLYLSEPWNSEVYKHSIGENLTTITNRMLQYCWITNCLLYTSPSPRDATLSRMPSSA